MGLNLKKMLDEQNQQKLDDQEKKYKQKIEQEREKYEKKYEQDKKQFEEEKKLIQARLEEKLEKKIKKKIKKKLEKKYMLKIKNMKIKRVESESDSDSDDSSDSSDDDELMLDITLIDNFNLNLNRTVLVYGHVQSGKRNWIIQYAINCINVGNHVFMISDNVKDYKKLIYESFVRTFEEDVDDFVLFNIKEDKLFTILNEGKPKIILMLNNPYDAKTMVNIMRRLSESSTNIKVNTIFDECDKISTDGSEHTSRRSNLAQHCIKNANGTLLITATPFANIWIKTENGNNILGEDIHLIPQPEDYINYDSTRDGEKILNIKTYDDDAFYEKIVTVSEIDGKKKEKIEKIVNYDSIKEMVSEFKSHTFRKRKRKGFNEKKKCTVIGGCFNVSNLKNTHYEIKDNLLEWYPNAYVIIVNGNYNKVYKNDTVKESKKSFVGTMYDIQKKWNRKEDKYLFAIGSVKLTRCTPLRAELKTMPKDCNDMLLITNMVYVCSDSATSDIIVQQAQRLNGRYPRKKTIPPLTLFTTEKVKKIIFNYSVEVEKQFIEIKKKPESNTLEASVALSKNISKDRQFSNVRGKQQKVIKNNLVYPTMESAENIIDNNSNNSSKPKEYSNIERCIIEVLSRIEYDDDNNLFMKVDEIFELGDFLEKTTQESVGSRCLELYKRGILKRMGIPYGYSLASRETIDFKIVSIFLDKKENITLSSREIYNIKFKDSDHKIGTICTHLLRLWEDKKVLYRERKGNEYRYGYKNYREL